MKTQPTHSHGEKTLKLSRKGELSTDAATRTVPTSPFKLNHILVPIDFSDCSTKALEYAVPLAKAHKAKITLLYVAEPTYCAGEFGGVEYAAVEANVREDGEKGLAKLVTDELRGEVQAGTLVRLGSPVREIIDVASRLPADLVVISTHGRTGLKHVLLGSVAEQVVQRSPCPVLVVREREREILASRTTVGFGTRREVAGAPPKS